MTKINLKKIRKTILLLQKIFFSKLTYILVSAYIHIYYKYKDCDFYLFCKQMKLENKLSKNQTLWPNSNFLYKLYLLLRFLFVCLEELRDSYHGTKLMSIKTINDLEISLVFGSGLGFGDYIFRVVNPKTLFHNKDYYYCVYFAKNRKK